MISYLMSFPTEYSSKPPPFHQAQAQIMTSFLLKSQTVCQPKYATNDGNGSELHGQVEKIRLDRQKRQATHNVLRDEKDSKNRCYLALVADHRFYQEIGNSDAKLTSAYLVSISDIEI